MRDISFYLRKLGTQSQQPLAHLRAIDSLSARAAQHNLPRKVRHGPDPFGMASENDTFVLGIGETEVNDTASRIFIGHSLQQPIRREVDLLIAHREQD